MTTVSLETAQEIGEGDAGEGVEPIVVRKLVPYLETP